MKIMIYAPVLGRGGVTRLAKKLANTWHELGHDVSVFTHYTNEHGTKIEWPEEVRGSRYCFIPNSHPKHPELFRYLTDNAGKFYDQLKQVLSYDPHDMIFLPMPWWSMRNIEWDIKTPTIAFIPDFASDYMPGLMNNQMIVGYRRECYQFAKHCHAITFASEFQRDHGVKRYGMKNTHVIRKPHFIPDGFEFEYHQPSLDDEFKEKYGVDGHYILACHCYGTKDPETLIRGYLGAKSIFPDLPKLVLAGIESENLNPNNKNGNRSLQGLIRASSLKWEDDFQIIGYVEEKYMRALYNRAEMVITASLSEGGVPGTICEAAVSETPVIYSEIPANVEVLGKDGSCGYSFEPGSPGDLSLAIARAWNDYGSFWKTSHELKHRVGIDHWKEIGRSYVSLV